MLSCQLLWLLKSEACILLDWCVVLNHETPVEVDGRHSRSEYQCKPRVDMLQRSGSLLRFGWQPSHGIGGRLRRFTHRPGASCTGRRQSPTSPRVIGRRSTALADDRRAARLLPPVKATPLRSESQERFHARETFMYHSGGVIREIALHADERNRTKGTCRWRNQPPASRVRHANELAAQRSRVAPGSRLI